MHKRKKIYHVFLDRILQSVFQSYRRIDLERIAADTYHILILKTKRIGIEIHSGQNRVIRRLFEKLGYKVVKLDRVYFAGLTKKNLPRGKWRFLTDKEISMLKRGLF